MNERTRTEQLTLAFKKAVKESFSTTSVEDDLNEIFGDSKQLVGKNDKLQQLYLNVIQKTESSIMESFHRLNNSVVIDQVIRRSIEGLDGSIMPCSNAVEGNNSLPDNEERPSLQLIRETHSLERKKLISTLQTMEFDIRKSRDVLARLKVQVDEEVGIAIEECEKMSQTVAKWRDTATSRNQREL
jgi:hypothetical protein